MDLDATLPLPRKDDEAREVFGFGEETILKMKDQLFTLDDYGTRINGNASAPEPEPSTPPPGLTAASDESISDPIARIEQKLDHAIRAVDALQRRLDSLDATVARLVTR